MPVEIIVKDSQSKENRAAEVAADLIHKDKVDLLLVASTPETTNPVGDQAETNEVPCISTMSPWQPWFFARGGKPDAGFKYTYHYFWGLEGRDRRLPGDVGQGADQQGSRRAVPQRQ